MKKSKSKNISKKIKEEDIILNYNESEIDGFQVFTPNEPLGKDKLKLNEVINPFELKNSNDFVKSWKTLEEIEDLKEEKELFEELWDNIIKLNNNNIIDYTLINELIRFLSNKILIQRFLFLLFSLMDDSLDNYNKNNTQNNFLILKNNIIFFMIIVLNLKNIETFTYYLTKEKIDYLAIFLDKIQKINNETKDFCNNIFFQLFSDEYIHLGLNLLLSEENIKSDDNTINKEAYKILNKFYQLNNENKYLKNEKNKEEKAKLVIDSFFNFESKNFLKLKQNYNIDYNELFYYQIELVQNIYLILFSKEKYKYLEENEEKFYEYDFLNEIIKKNIAETKEIHCDKYKNLFRRDTLSNYLIKYFFFIFGNYMIIESIVKPFNKILNITGLNSEFEIISFQGNSINAERNITKDEFNILFDNIIDKLNENIPFILRIFLKMIYDNVIKEYPNLDKDDYTPISSLFFFCYISNPRIQQIYEILQNKYLLIKSVYKLLYNASFNLKFQGKDDLYFFNDEIGKYNEKIKDFYENNVLNIDMNDDENKKYLKNFFEQINIEYPEFIFYLNCEYLYNLIDNNNINIKNNNIIINNNIINDDMKDDDVKDDYD